MHNQIWLSPGNGECMHVNTTRCFHNFFKTNTLLKSILKLISHTSVNVNLLLQHYVIHFKDLIPYSQTNCSWYNENGILTVFKINFKSVSVFGYLYSHSKPPCCHC